MRRETNSILDQHDDLSVRELAHKYFHLLLDGERRAASELILDAVARGTDIRDIYLGVFQPVQYEIGRLWQADEISVAAEHYCTAATQLIISQLFPYIAASPKIGRTMVGCCVGGELHELGMRVVCDFFEMEGWNTFFLGANTPDDAVIASLRESRAELLGISVTMTYNVHLVRRLVAAVKASDLNGRVRILVGGLPFQLSPGLLADVGGDATARNALHAVRVGARLVGGGA
ncbi:cobalamin B12-binding domain-containing protein [Paucidesulfovibrio longus]|uniref:cobalamin B12-binding domain-containing protein n=1 Tax=Paucidesulfovibrio longus TaxID=889 RepID=UPI0003B727A8|nr:cobalamin-dependent protein [Paucidesulfovibrio longus]